MHEAVSEQPQNCVERLLTLIGLCVVLICK